MSNIMFSNSYSCLMNSLLCVCLRIFSNVCASSSGEGVGDRFRRASGESSNTILLRTFLGSLFFANLLVVRKVSAFLKLLNTFAAIMDWLRIWIWIVPFELMASRGYIGAISGKYMFG